jgi:hypothetical protein
MAEERTLGLVRAQEQSSDDLSKEELQRRLDEARGSISNTVTEIKETVANQVQAVKDTLDWREQFKRRPIAWSAGAAGVGFMVGYCIAATFIDSDRDELRFTPAESHPRSYAGQALVGQSTPEFSMKRQSAGNGHTEEKGPGFFHRLAETPAYGRVKDEASSVADTLLQELGNTAKLVVIPALIKSVKNFLGNHLPGVETGTSDQPASKLSSKHTEKAGYQPVLE